MNEKKNPNCQICSDDSQSLATVTLQNIAETTLEVFIDEVLKESLKIDTNCIQVIFDDVLFERDPYLSDEEEITRYQKRLKKKLGDFKIKNYSNLFVEAKFTNDN